MRVLSPFARWRHTRRAVKSALADLSVLLSESRDNSIQVVFELFVYFTPIFTSVRMHRNRLAAGLCASQTPRGVGPKEGARGEKELREGDGHPIFETWLRPEI